METSIKWQKICFGPQTRYQDDLFYFYLYIYPLDSQESDGGANT